MISGQTGVNDGTFSVGLGTMPMIRLADYVDDALECGGSRCGYGRGYDYPVGGLRRAVWQRRRRKREPLGAVDVSVANERTTDRHNSSFELSGLRAGVYRIEKEGGSIRFRIKRSSRGVQRSRIPDRLLFERGHVEGM